MILSVDNFDVFLHFAAVVILYKTFDIWDIFLEY